MYKMRQRMEIHSKPLLVFLKILGPACFQMKIMEAMSFGLPVYNILLLSPFFLRRSLRRKASSSGS